MLFVVLLVWIQSSESVTTKSEVFGNAQSSKPSITSSTKTTLPRVLKNDDYEPSASISSPYLMPFSSVPMNFHPQWLNDGVKPDGNWFGFNRFITRTARNMVQNQRIRDAQLLGEGTFLYPTTLYPGPAFYYEHANPFLHHINDLQGQSSVPYQDHFVNPRVEQTISFARGRQQQNFYNQNNQNYQNQNHQNFQNQNHQNFNYQRSNSNLQRSSASPTPVTIKIIPLKLSAMDISNALKSMSWIPIPFDMLKGNNNNNNSNQSKDNNQPVYSDKRQSSFDDDEEEDESDLPPPSSHVATPPVGITHAEGRKSERFVRRFATPK